MATVPWSKDLARDLITAGMRVLAKKFHPDMGGTHEQMLVLTATTKHLTALVGGDGKRQDDWVRVDEFVVEIGGVTCIRETEKALLCRIRGETMWIPISQIEDGSDIWQRGDEGTLIITTWLAKKVGLA